MSIDRSRAQEQELVGRCIAGDPEAWEAFVRGHSPFLEDRLRSLAFRRGASLSPGDLDDLVSKVWEDLLRDDKRVLRQFPEGAVLDRWLLGVAAHRLLVFLRSKGRERRSLETSKADLSALDPDTPPPEDEAQRSEREERVRKALRLLPARQRFALGVFYEAGWTHREIARTLRLPINHVGPLLLAARNRLRELLQNVELLLF